MDATARINYGTAILAGFEYLLERYPEVFVIGQGLWSPWYVGSSMTDLDKKFGTHRIIDTPVSELACTGAAVGAGLAGMRPIVVHPRIDFMLYAMDAIVNQAAKWSHMFGGQAHPAVVFRGIVNRGGEQGAQHSQLLHAWFSHVPGLRVVMPYTPTDARDLLIASTLCNDPVVYIDDRWLYEQECPDTPIRELDLRTIGPLCLRAGKDVTLVGSGYSTHLCMVAAGLLETSDISAEVFDLRVLNPLDCDDIARSVEKTGLLVAVDGSWSNCGMAGEVIAQVCERIDPRTLRAAPQRVTLPAAPAPASKPLEAGYYPTADQVADVAKQLFESAGKIA
jgi:acetoin:2,6-dichlorophenolindophenol oxidoreductase subunit beta